MDKFTSVDDILDFAITTEEEAFRFYTSLAAGMDNPRMHRVFEEFAAQEKSHKEKLLAVKDGKLLVAPQKTVADLKIADYLTDVEPGPDMDYRTALIVAMKKEKKAFKLYTDLAESAENENIKNLFLSLAQEEARHKLVLETEYDDFVYSEN